MGKLFKGAIKLASTIQPTGNQPLDDRCVVSSYSDLLAKSTFGTAVYLGMQVAIAGTSNVYILVNTDGFLGDRDVLDSDWGKVSGEGYGSVSADTYNTALSLATTDNIGQIIYAVNNYEDGDDKYDAGAYIVTGNGTLQKLAQSSASGNIEADLASLTTRVSTLETKQETDDNTIHMLTGDDIED